MEALFILDREWLALPVASEHLVVAASTAAPGFTAEVGSTAEVEGFTAEVAAALMVADPSAAA